MKLLLVKLNKLNIIIITYLYLEINKKCLGFLCNFFSLHFMNSLSLGSIRYLSSLTVYESMLCFSTNLSMKKKKIFLRNVKIRVINSIYVPA